MRLNKWFGKLNIRLEIRWKKRYHHSYEYVMRKITRASLMYGTGFAKVEWIKPWQIWKKGWKLSNYIKNPTNPS